MAKCPDCGNDPDSTTDAGCPTCEGYHTYDNPTSFDDDDRWNAWDGDDDWADDIAADADYEAFADETFASDCEDYNNE